ncbi:glycosyltransferase family 2 protein [Loktanella sp. DJP18]|uniref:glycosyltransferase family 2 protein n=1 Tax=Loktanella sp. DJP18 TaxID=3409788 RepID=UPI003BB5E440
MQAASVIVVSNGRPEALRRCLLGLLQIDHPACEIIVVADALSRPAIAASGLADVIKTVACDRPNISAARNAGLAVAAGDIVAFIDDDAVPEPTWLSHLTAPFADAAVQASGGFVRARNGITFQWRARLAFGDATTTGIEVDDRQPTLMAAGPGRAVKTEGTNMAIRRDTLAALGGFDEAFAFYLDETDVNLRLAAQSATTAIVPLAQVHHGFAPSPRRRADRVPRDLFEIGASLAVFLRKHGPAVQPTPHVPRADQRRRLLAHMVAGRLMPGDVGRLLRTFDAGWRDGMTRRLAQHPPLTEEPVAFLPFPTRVSPHRMIGARFWQRARAEAQAAQVVADGGVATLLVLSPTSLFHHCQFTPAGVWDQTGGQFGKSDRTDPPFRLWRAAARRDREYARIMAVRVPQGHDLAISSENN